MDNQDPFIDGFVYQVKEANVGQLLSQGAKAVGPSLLAGLAVPVVTGAVTAPFNLASKAVGMGTNLVTKEAPKALGQLAKTVTQKPTGPFIGQQKPVLSQAPALGLNKGAGFRDLVGTGVGLASGFLPHPAQRIGGAVAGELLKPKNNRSIAGAATGAVANEGINLAANRFFK